MNAAVLSLMGNVTEAQTNQQKLTPEEELLAREAAAGIGGNPQPIPVPQQSGVIRQ
jgi:hypothetical protein